jgi:CheY-like chemotaxis protein
VSARISYSGIVRPRILVVDASDSSRRALCNCLFDAGYEVHELPSSIGASRELLKKQVRAVVIDANMPVLSGDGLSIVLRKNPRLEGLVIVLIGPDERVEELRRLGAAHVVVGRSGVPKELIRHMSRLVSLGPVEPGPLGRNSAT